jgi:hexosaminidase
MYTRMEQVSRLLEFTGIQHRTNYLPMLDRLAGWRDASPLTVLADAVDALGIEGRRDERKYSSPVPLNRLVDAARPESEPMWALTRSIESWLATRSPEDAAAVERLFTAWKANPAELRSLARQNFLLEELLPISENLAAAGRIGSEAMAFLQNRQNPPEGWTRSSAQALEQYEKPKAETRLAAVHPVRVLLDALRPAKSGENR